jgi:hypothetical protein
MLPSAQQDLLLEEDWFLPALLGSARRVALDLQTLLLRRMLRLRRMQLRTLLERMAQRSAAVLRSV